MKHQFFRYVLISICLVGIWHLALAGKFYVKAFVADHLIKHAWQTHLVEGSETKPWPWADTWPVAELVVPRLNIKQMVLMGDSGRVLAFGPGLTESSALPGEKGLSVISGHRDTHFEFLKDVREGDTFIIKTHKGATTYLVDALLVVDQREVSINRAFFSEGEDTYLMLVTCYPFDALTSGGDLRFIVTAKNQNNGA